MADVVFNVVLSFKSLTERLSFGVMRGALPQVVAGIPVTVVARRVLS